VSRVARAGVLRVERLCWACVTGVSCSLIAAGVCGERPGRSRTGRSPAVCGAGGVLEVAGREPDDLAAGNGSPGVVRGIRLFQVVPCFRVIRCGQCRWLHSSLRVDPGRGRGAWGGSASEGRSGGANQIGAPPRRRGGQNSLRPRAWRGAECLAASRLAVCPGGAVHAARAVWVTGGSSRGWDRQRICPSRIP